MAGSNPVYGRIRYSFKFKLEETMGRKTRERGSTPERVDYSNLLRELKREHAARTNSRTTRYYRNDDRRRSYNKEDFQ